MKKILMSTMLILMITACSPDGESTASPAEPNESTPSPVEREQTLDPLEEQIVKQLAANLGFEEDEILIVHNEETEFSDSCLGVSMQDVACKQVLTPGRMITLEVDGIQYEYHTSADGRIVQPATFAMMWKREGGIAGFCDNLTVFLSGEVYGQQCRAESDIKMDTFANLLSTKERKQFDAWISDYGQVTLDASDPEGVADRMEVVLVFYGLANEQPSKPQQQEMINWAQDVYQKLYS